MMSKNQDKYKHSDNVSLESGLRLFVLGFYSVAEQDIFGDVSDLDDDDGDDLGTSNGDIMREGKVMELVYFPLDIEIILKTP